jgi:hypothetical protein
MKRLFRFLFLERLASYRVWLILILSLILLGIGNMSLDIHEIKHGFRRMVGS